MLQCNNVQLFTLRGRRTTLQVVPTAGLVPTNYRILRPTTQYDMNKVAFGLPWSAPKEK